MEMICLSETLLTENNGNLVQIFSDSRKKVKYDELYIETKVNMDLNIYFSSGGERKRREGFSPRFHY